MKRLQVFVLAILLSFATLVICAPQAFAAESDTEGEITAPAEGEDPEPGEDPEIEPGWHEEDGAWYYLLEDGTRATGWLTLDEGTYWLGDDGIRLDNTWLELDGNKYWFDENGVRFEDGWTIIDGMYYYFVEANLQRNVFVNYGGYTYFLNGTGNVLTGWLVRDSARYYAGSNGRLYKSQWLNTNNAWYYFGSDMKMLADTYTVYNGGVYVFNTDGKMRTGWMEYDGSWLYAGSDGKLYRNQTLTYNGKSYYFGSDFIATALGGKWEKTNDNWYFRLDNGTYAKGWNEIGGKWYYFSGTGFLFTNRWIKTNGNFYYVGSNGAAYFNSKTPDGATVDASGKRVSGPADSKAQGYSSPTNYLILVNYTYHTVNIYQGSLGNWKLVQCYPCSMGKDSTPTPLGTHYIAGKTYSFGDADHTCYYASGFIGMQYLFHSVLYYPGTWTVKDGRLGRNISNGCIRLFVDDAHWIYNNVPVNTRVEVYR